ncbi:hypothetical protein HDV03_000522 [Kappamyces sp. JEL0829]|nr:hypothetical protein HDV03_000522 [Kappamyces sp. JEL0829]
MFLNFGYIIGFLLPFIPFLLNKAFPSPNWRKINVVLLTAAMISMPTGSQQTFIVMPVLVAWFFQYYLYNHQREFWDKYAWIIASAFDSAAPFATFGARLLAVYKVMFPAWALNPANAQYDYYCYEQPLKLE